MGLRRHHKSQAIEMPLVVLGKEINFKLQEADFAILHCNTWLTFSYVYVNLPIWEGRNKSILSYSMETLLALPCGKRPRVRWAKVWHPNKGGHIWC